MSIAAAMERAGVNVVESRLRSLAHDALLKHHRNVERALKTFETGVDGDEARSMLVRELMRFYLEQFNLDGAGHPPHGTLNSGAGSTDRAGSSQKPLDNRTRHARPGAEPSASQRHAAGTVAKVLAITVLDTFKVRDGRAIGDVRYGELDRMRGANLLEASVIQQIKEHGVADHNARVRDVVKADVLQRMIQRAAEVSDAS